MAGPVGGPPVWSELIHIISNWGTVPLFRSLANSCSQISTRKLVGDAEIELRVVLDCVVNEIREWRVGGDGVEVVELLLCARFIVQGVVVEVGPAWLHQASRRP
jgi:hypothetical protein